MGAGQGMDASLEVAVAREDGGGHEVLFLDGRGDFGRDGAGVADAGGAPIPDDVEAKGVQGDLPLALSGPSDWQTGYADGRLTSVHLRRFASPVPVAGAPLVVQVYDPSFYTAYSIASATLTGAAPGCKPQTFVPDAAAADRILQDAIAELAGSSDVEGAFPAVGAAYAEEVRVTCAAPS